MLVCTLICVRLIREIRLVTLESVNHLWFLSDRMRFCIVRPHFCLMLD